jgi:hypothetical protein
MEMLLIMLQCHMCFFWRSSLCLLSLLIQQLPCHLKFVHRFTYCRFQRNWHTRKPYSKFFVTIFIWFLPFVSFHNGSPLYRVSQEECARLREGVPYVKVYGYNPKHLCPKLNGYGDNGQRKMWSSLGFHALYLSAESLINLHPWVWCHIMTHASSNYIPSGW